MKLVRELLWVEDQAEFVDALRPLIDGLVDNVRHVQDAVEAERVLKSSQFDFVLLDLQLPPGQWGGMELLRRLGSSVSDTPIVVVSGAGTTVQCAEALRQGAMDYVVKEQARELLVPIIKQVLEKFISTRPSRAYDRLRKIEKSLKRIVISALRSAAAGRGVNMFKAYVPKPIALKTYERWLHADGGEQDEFFDLLDLAEVIKARWLELEIFRALGVVLNPRTTEDRVKWLIRLNQVRQIIAHPVRGELESQHREVLDRADDIVTRWADLLDTAMDSRKAKGQG